MLFKQSVRKYAVGIYCAMLILCVATPTPATVKPDDTNFKESDLCQWQRDLLDLGHYSGLDITRRTMLEHL